VSPSDKSKVMEKKNNMDSLLLITIIIEHLLYTRNCCKYFT
jgi:hypothetical protein